MKLKQKASVRPNRRYFLIESSSSKEIEDAILEYVGIQGWSKAIPVIIPKGKGKFILAVERSSVNSVRAALAFAKSELKIIKVSGTIKQLEK